MKICGQVFRFCVIATLFVSAARADDALNDKATVSGPASIQLPKGWSSATGGRGPAASRTLIVAMAPQRDKDATGEFQSALVITADAAVELNGEAQQALVAKGVPNYKAVEAPSAITVNGMKGVTFGGTFTSGSLVLRSRQYMLVQNNQLFVITITSLNSRWAAYRPTVEASVGTFTVKQ